MGEAEHSGHGIFSLVAISISRRLRESILKELHCDFIVYPGPSHHVDIESMHVKHYCHEFIGYQELKNDVNLNLSTSKRIEERSALPSSHHIFPPRCYRQRQTLRKPTDPTTNRPTDQTSTPVVISTITLPAPPALGEIPTATNFRRQRNGPFDSVSSQKTRRQPPTNNQHRRLHLHTDFAASVLSSHNRQISPTR